MIAETIKLLQSAHWYGCGEHIEIAKGKRSIPRNWKQASEKIKRDRKMHAAAIRAYKEKITNTIISWLSGKK